MRRYSCYWRTATLTALVANGSLAFAGETEFPVVELSPTQRAPRAPHLKEILVVGKRASLASALESKRDKTEIVDTVVAEDIDKLPDFNVSDALSRVTGVQILRDRGEGAGVTVRGLNQFETLINGREAFTAGIGRSLDFSDIPSEMLAGIDVYKSAAADQIEGGIGGTIDLRTRRPFDFKGREIAASARLIHGSLVDKSEPQVSLLASDRWAASSGEFGALLNLAYQKRAWREDQKSAGNPVLRRDLVAGQAVTVPNGTSETVSLGDRERIAGHLGLQWRPSRAMEFYAEGSYSEFRTRQDSYQISLTAPANFVAGSPVLFPGSSDVRSITWSNAPLSVLGFGRDTLDRVAQGAVGGVWKGEKLTLKADLSHTRSDNDLYFSGLNLGGTAANFSQDLSGSVPSTRITGTDLLDPANYRIAGVLYRTRPYAGDLSAFRLDGEYAVDRGFLDSIAAGMRLSRRHADDAPGLLFGDAATTIAATTKPGYVVTNPYGDFFSGSMGIGSYLVGNPATFRDAAGLRDAMGVTAPLPVNNPLGTWRIAEETSAAYLMARFHGWGGALDGNAGLRAVRTRETVEGSRTVPGSNGVASINDQRDYTDILPSLNLRHELDEGLILRLAASKSLTRPNFDQLSPSLTLLRNSVNPALNTGSAGNPGLAPLRSRNFDVAVERYFSATTALHLGGFVKKVEGFVTTVSSPETYAGETYQVSRPQSGAAGDIRGLELGYQQFYEALPGVGLQANYTYVDSASPSSILGQDTPLQNFSRNSFNLVGMYEKGRVSARLAYNWRDKFLSGITNVVGVGALPVYTKAYGWLDASITYRYSDKVSFAVEGLNLLRTVRSSYFGVESRPQSSWKNDLQLGVAVTLRY